MCGLIFLSPALCVWEEMVCSQNYWTAWSTGRCRTQGKTRPPQNSRSGLIYESESFQPVGTCTQGKQFFSCKVLSWALCWFLREMLSELNNVINVPLHQVLKNTILEKAYKSMFRSDCRDYSWQLLKGKVSFMYRYIIMYGEDYEYINL